MQNHLLERSRGSLTKLNRFPVVCCFVSEEKLELAVLPQRSDVVWQALVSPECGDGLPHYLNTESLVCCMHLH